ncbi:hypothetical protein ACLQ3B_31965 [Micromonospora sp. DT53]|uniref:hypothetical protein n=1 Tax=Micromonospora sp. DT53 TaxID=3393444 RepID=UPI003CF8D46A
MTAEPAERHVPVSAVQQREEPVSHEQVLVRDLGDDVGHGPCPLRIGSERLVELADDKRPTRDAGEVDVTQGVANGVQVLNRPAAVPQRYLGEEFA